MATAHWSKGHYSEDAHPGILKRTSQYSYTEYSIRLDLLACRSGWGHVILIHSPSNESITDKLYNDEKPSTLCMHPVE